MTAICHPAQPGKKHIAGRYFLILLFSAALFLFQGCGAHRNGAALLPEPSTVKYSVLDVPVYAQETRKWCWAAGGEMIMSYYGKPVPQHVQANNRFNRRDCGLAERPRACIKGGRPEFEKYGFQPPQSRYGPLSWQELTNQIDELKPVGFSWEWKTCKSRRSFGTHYMVVRGYIIYRPPRIFSESRAAHRALPVSRLVVVNDPLPQASGKTKGGSVLVMTYDDYIGFCPRYTHAYTHFDIAGSARPPGRKYLSNFTRDTGPSPDLENNFDEIKHLISNQGAVPALSHTDPQKAAAQSLKLLKSLPPLLLLELGFHSPRMIERCKLGDPLRAYGLHSNLEQLPLKNKNQREWLTQSNEIHFPVMVGNQPVTSIVVRKRGSRWAFALIGDKNAAAAVRAIKHIPHRSGPIPEYFIIRLPSVNLSFLAYISLENRLYFILTNVLPDLHLPVNIPVPAEDVLWIIKQLHDDPGSNKNKKKDDAEALGDAVDWLSQVLKRIGVIKKKIPNQ